MADPAKTYDGEPCGNCGETLRYRSLGRCVTCARAKQKRWRTENQDHYREYQRARYADPARRAAVLQRQKERYANDPGYRERVIAYQRARYESLDHIAYNEVLLRNRRHKALKRKEKRHGSLSDEG